MPFRRILMYLLAPNHPIGWPLRLLFWCALIAAVTILVEFALGLLEPEHVLEHAGLIICVTGPLMLAVMWLTRHLIDMQDRLVVLANHDPLTAIANRRAFFDAMEKAGHGTMLMIDADHFKAINDTYGHTIGDQVLVRIAQHLQACTRADDLVGRLGGEEFAVFLAGADEQRAHIVGQRIAEGLTLPLELPQPISVTLSVGGAHSRQAENRSGLIKLADKALYAAKAAGRARLVMWPRRSSEAA